MALSASLGENPEQKKQTNVPLFKFPFPVTRSLRFEQIIKAEANSPSFNSLAGLTRAREELSTALMGAGRGQSYDQLRTAIERYVPLVFGLTEALEAHPSLRLSQPLQFAWSSPFREASAVTRTWSTFLTPEYEVVMALLSQGILLANTAEAMSRSMDARNFGDAAPRAAMLLRQAAGVFEYIATNELPRWTNAPDDRPPETFSTSLCAVASLCLAAAQELMVLKGVSSGTSPSLLAKLMADAQRRYQEAADTLNMRQPKATANVGQPLRDFSKAMAALSKAQVYKFCALNAQAAGKGGEALGYANEALAQFRSVLTAPALASWRANTLETLRLEIEHVQRVTQLDCEMVSYSRAVDPRMLELPEPRSIVTAVPYTPTRSEVIIS